MLYVTSLSSLSDSAPATSLAVSLWTPSTVLAEFFYARFTFGEEPAAFLDRFAFWWGVPYPLLVLALAGAPLLAGFAMKGKAP